MPKWKAVITYTDLTTHHLIEFRHLCDTLGDVWRYVSGVESKYHVETILIERIKES